MFIITNGTEWVMENPLKQGEYLRTTYPVQAKEFSLKEAKALMNRKGKAISWIRSFDIVDCGSGEKCKNVKNYKGNGKVYIGENDIPFNEDIITNIYDEVNSIKNLYGWSLTQLKTYREDLTRQLSKLDSEESDICHALQKYREDNNGRRAQAHKMSKVCYLLDEVRDKRKNVKQCILYVEAMERSINNGYSIEQIKLELSKAKHNEYQGRTDMYQKVLNMLK